MRVTYAHRPTTRSAPPPTRSPGPASSRSSSPRRRGSPSSTAPTGCSACSCSRCHDLERLLTTADVAAAMSVEGLLGTDRVFAADLQALRPHPGQAVAAHHMRAMLAGSQIVASHAGPADTRVQDAYSLRCAPQVNGAARDTLAHARVVAGRELASAIDNPVVLPDGRVESNGNFHGAPLAYVLDFLADRRGRRRQHVRTPDRPVPRRRPQPRPAGVPRPRSRGRLGHMIAAVHPGRDRERAEAARRARERRLDPVLGDAGGPRVDGLVRGAQAAPGARRPDAGTRRRGAHRRPRPRPPRAAGARPRHRRGPGWRCVARFRDPGPTGSCPRRSRRPSTSSGPVPLLAAAESVTGGFAPGQQ